MRRLLQDMNVTSFKVRLVALLERINRGQLATFKIQRPYVWKPEHVIQFVADIVAGKSIGSMRVWEPGSISELVEQRWHRLGPVELPAATILDGLLVDGTQRLATLAWMLFDPATTTMPTDLSAAERLTWGSGRTLVADLATCCFTFVPSAESRIGLKLPARALLDRSVSDATISERERYDAQWRPWPAGGLNWWSRAVAAFQAARVDEIVVRCPPSYFGDRMRIFEAIGAGGLTLSRQSPEEAARLLEEIRVARSHFKRMP